MAKALIAYYSRAGENYFGGAYRVIEKGNTRVVAEKLEAFTGADIFEIDQKEKYSDNYNECIEQAKRDKSANARPELTGWLDGIEEYDTIYLLYPNYWGTMPMAVWTFLEHYDFSGKTIRPLCTNEGSGMGASVQDIKKLAKGATVENGLAITGSSVGSCDASLKSWI